MPILKNSSKTILANCPALGRMTPYRLYSNSALWAVRMKELFELKEKNIRPRRQAVVLFLQQLFGDTVERKSIETINSLFSSENRLYMLENIKNTCWINGTFQTRFSTQNALFA
jgi:hypothetical protein